MAKRFAGRIFVLATDRPYQEAGGLRKQGWFVDGGWVGLGVTYVQRIRTALV